MCFKYKCELQLYHALYELMHHPSFSTSSNMYMILTNINY